MPLYEKVAKRKNLREEVATTTPFHEKVAKMKILPEEVAIAMPFYFMKRFQMGEKTTKKKSPPRRMKRVQA